MALAAPCRCCPVLRKDAAGVPAAISTMQHNIHPPPSPFSPFTARVSEPPHSSAQQLRGPAVWLPSYNISGVHISLVLLDIKDCVQTTLLGHASSLIVAAPKLESPCSNQLLAGHHPSYHPLLTPRYLRCTWRAMSMGCGQDPASRNAAISSNAALLVRRGSMQLNDAALGETQ